MDQSTEQNAALVEEALAATRSLNEQAQELSRTVEQFRVDEFAGSYLALGGKIVVINWRVSGIRLNLVKASYPFQHHKRKRP